MKYKAVIFDLFGTLVNSYPAKQYHEDIFQIANVLGVDGQGFYDLWVDSYNERAIGKFDNIQQSIAKCCEKLSKFPSENKLATAESMFLKFTWQYLIVKPDAVSTINMLKDMGFKIGLISDCTHLLMPFWDKLPFASLIEKPVFSVKVKIKKPDERIYHIACENLGVKPTECIYVGDGGSHELSGAKQVGMRPILVKSKNHQTAILVYGAEDWQGEYITTLSEIIALDIL